MALCDSCSASVLIELSTLKRERRPAAPSSGLGELPARVTRRSLMESQRDGMQRCTRGVDCPGVHRGRCVAKGSPAKHEPDGLLGGGRRRVRVFGD